MAFLVCIPIAGIIARKFDKKIEEGIPLAVFFITFVTYILGLLGFLYTARTVVSLLAVIAAVVMVYGIYKEHFYMQHITFGGIVYVILGGYYTFVCRGRMVSNQDDLLVYGKYVADFYNTGKICRYDYVPGMMIWEYLGEKFWPFFSESILFLSVAMFCVALLLAIFSSKRIRNKSYYFFIVLLIILLPIITLERDSYFRLQNDFVLGIITAYIVCMYQKARESDDSFYEYSAIFAMAFLSITKSTGLILGVILILFFWGIDVVWNDNKVSFKNASFVIKCALAVALVNVSWLLYAASQKKYVKFMWYVVTAIKEVKSKWLYLGGIILLLIISLLFFKWIADNRKSKTYVLSLLLLSVGIFAYSYEALPSNIRADSIKNFAKVVFSTYAPDRAFGFGYRFYVPYAMVFAVLMFIWSIILTVGFINEKSEMTEINKQIVIMLNVGLVIFLAILFLTNSITRGSNQIARAKECERYIYAYVVFYILTCIYLFVHCELINAKISFSIMAFLSTVILMIGNTTGVVTQVFAKDGYYNFDGLNYLDIELNDKFFYVDQKGELNYSRFNFRISPGTMQNYYFSDMVIDGYWLGNDEGERNLTLEEWNKILTGCKYVYVAATNDEFEEMYGSLFDDEIIDGHIYYVISDNEQVHLKSIEYN